MRYGDHNFRNRQLYEECHENPYYQKKLELMEKKQTNGEKMTRWTKFLIWLGIRTPCCGAEFIEKEIGWDRMYCKKCDKRYKYD